jgi:hypothetical protein
VVMVGGDKVGVKLHACMHMFLGVPRIALRNIFIHVFNWFLIVCLGVKLYLFSGKFILFFLILKLQHLVWG